MAQKTSAMAILLTNNSSVNLSLISSSISGSSSQSSLDMPQNIAGNSTDGGIGTKSSETPYTAEWTYSPDGGETHLKFTASLNGKTGITITPSKNGPQADQWQTAESPSFENGIWVIRYTYSKNA